MGPRLLDPGGSLEKIQCTNHPKRCNLKIRRFFFVGRVFFLLIVRGTTKIAHRNHALVRRRQGTKERRENALLRD